MHKMNYYKLKIHEITIFTLQKPKKIQISQWLFQMSAKCPIFEYSFVSGSEIETRIIFLFKVNQLEAWGQCTPFFRAELFISM